MESLIDKDKSYPLVSIIMPCYNDGEYINEAVESALAQTYPNVEIIIVNDASTDPFTIEVLKSISHPRIAVYHNAENLRPAGARNKGISLANGKYILPLDADDVIDESYVQKALDAIEHDVSIGAVYCKAELFGLQSGLFELSDYSIDNMLVDNCVFATALFLKDDWLEIGGYPEDFEAGLEDYDFWLSILELGKGIYQIPEVLFYYRIKDQSRTIDFADNLSAMKQTYRQLYLNHPALYGKYNNEFVESLRDSWLDLRDSVRSLTSHINHVENELTGTKGTLVAANDAIWRLEHENESLKQSLQQMRNSTSWKITKPLRVIVRGLKFISLLIGKKKA